MLCWRLTFRTHFIISFLLLSPLFIPPDAHKPQVNLETSVSLERLKQMSPNDASRSVKLQFKFDRTLSRGALAVAFRRACFFCLLINCVFDFYLFQEN